MIFLCGWLLLGLLTIGVNALNEKYQDKWKEEYTHYIRTHNITDKLVAVVLGPILLLAAAADSYVTFGPLRRKYNKRKFKC